MEFLLWLVNGFVTMFVAEPRTGRHRNRVGMRGQHRLTSA
jgi:hypothetical protein